MLLKMTILLLTLVLIAALWVIVRLHRTIAKYQSFGIMYYLESLLGELAGSAVVTDPAGKMVYVNKTFINKSGYVESELLGQDISMLKANLTTDYVASDLWTHLRSNQVWRGPFINQTKLGEVYTEEFIVFALHDSLGDVYYCAIGHTVANRFLEEQALQNVQKQSIRFKENFISNLSHEVRTPLNAMLGLSQLGQKGEHPDRFIGYFSKINVAAKQLMQLMDDILDFSKIESGSFNLVKSRFNFMSLMTSLIGQYGPIAAEKRLEFLVVLDEYCPQYIFSDSYRLEQILSNLMSNAIKYTESGEIQLNIGLSPQLNGYALDIKVRDSGIGMTSEQVTGLFNPFNHLVSDEQKRHTNSSGLGMAITKQIVDLMKGKIEISSIPGAGTLVEVSLPFDGQDLELPSRDADSGIEHLTILLAEAPSNAREHALNMIRGFQYEVVVADTAESLLCELDSRTNFDLIMIDWRLAQIDRYALLHEIAQRGHEHMKLLIITPYPPESLTESTRRLIHAYLPKPFTASMLFDELASLFIAKGLETTTRRGDGLLKDLNVLLVDDNPVNNLIAKNQFENEGARAVTFLKASKALEYLKQHYFDFIVSDIDMPEMDGFEFLKALRDQGHTLPVAALTANTSDQYRQDILTAGFDAYLSKPLTNEKMIHLVEVLRQKGIGRLSKSIEAESIAEPSQVADTETALSPEILNVVYESLKALKNAAKSRKPKVCKESLNHLQQLIGSNPTYDNWFEVVQKDLQTYRFDPVIEAVDALMVKLGGTPT